MCNQLFAAQGGRGYHRALIRTIRGVGYQIGARPGRRRSRLSLGYRANRALTGVSS